MTNAAPVSIATSAYPGFSAAHHKISRPMDDWVKAAPGAFLVPVNASGEVSLRIGRYPERLHTFGPNSIVISGLSLSWRMRTAPVDVLVLEFSAEIQSRIDNAGWLAADLVHIVQDDLLHRIAAILLPSVAQGCRNGCVFADNLAATLIAHVDRNYGPGSDRAESGSSDGLPASVLRQIQDTVESRLSEPLRVRDLADVARLSEFHFLRAFKRSTGLSPHQYITERRINRARTLLSTTDIPVAEIAWRVGLSNPSHFNAQFRKHTGVTPGAWREQGASATRLETA
jgi:AraC family transcriptional regulator